MLYHDEATTDCGVFVVVDGLLFQVLIHPF